jgi:hypothetical protein
VVRCRHQFLASVGLSTHFVLGACVLRALFSVQRVHTLTKQRGTVATSAMRAGGSCLVSPPRPSFLLISAMAAVMKAATVDCDTSSKIRTSKVKFNSSAHSAPRTAFRKLAYPALERFLPLHLPKPTLLTVHLILSPHAALGKLAHPALERLLDLHSRSRCPDAAYSTHSTDQTGVPEHLVDELVTVDLSCRRSMSWSTRRAIPKCCHLLCVRACIAAGSRE